MGVKYQEEATQAELDLKADKASPTFTGTITTALTASRAVATGASGVLAASATTSTELGYVNGVTSAIQTQMNLKAPAASPTFTGTVTTPATASRALVTGSSSELAAATTTATEIGYVNGVTSSIQTQMNLKAPLASPTFTGTLTTPATASRALVTGSSSELTASATTATELGYVNGVTSAIQTQINTKTTSFSSSQSIADTPSGHGSTNTKIRIYSNQATTGSDITYATSAENGGSWTINTAGVYAVNVSDTSTSAAQVGISLNSNQLTTAIASITTAHIIAYTNVVATLTNACGTVVRCAANDVLRVHTSGGNDGTGAYNQVRIVRII